MLGCERWHCLQHQNGNYMAYTSCGGAVVYVVAVTNTGCSMGMFMRAQPLSKRMHICDILAEGAMTLPVTLSGGVLFAS